MRLRRTEFHTLLAILCVAFTLGSAGVLAQTVNVTTWHNDIARKGQNTNDPLTYPTITKTVFGKICSAALESKQIHAQPLIVTNVNFNNQGYGTTVAYVATEWVKSVK